MTPSTVLSNIRDIKAGKIKIDPRVGICKNIGIRVIPIKILKSWDKYSKDYLCPVPSTEEYVNAEEKYTKEAIAKNLWNKDTEYGRLRYELLDFIEEYIKDCTTYIVNSVSVCNYEDCDEGVSDDDYVVIVKDSFVPQDESIEEILSKAYDEGKNLLNIPCVVKVGFF